MRITALTFFLAAWPASGAAGSASGLPDIDVTHIERTPKYNPIPWIFPDHGPQYQGDPRSRRPFSRQELKRLKERPAQGDLVRFTAHVINASAVAAPGFSVRWLLDDKVVANARGKALKPWEKTSFHLDWKWINGPHQVQFIADSAELVAEACEKNNSITDRTDALALQMRVTQQLYDAFRSTPNKLGSRSFEDWVQRHIQVMNNTFAACVYPQTCPRGILERVRVDDFIIMTKDQMNQRLPQSMGCDGGWNFYDDNFPAWFDGHVGMDFHTTIDWSLIHELTHQLGIIDLYTIVVSGHWNHVRDAQGQPIWIGYGGTQPCIMSGAGIRTMMDGSTPPPLTLKVSPDGRVTAGQKFPFMAYSEHTAGGLNSLMGKRRGHFGLYLFDVPVENYLKILDNMGNPVQGTRVTVYQQTPQPGPQSISPTSTRHGITDSRGIYSLGNRPFGDINTIGLNGILFFVIQAREQTEYRFLDITQFNIAHWQGLHKFIATFRTGIPPPGGPPPVRNLRCSLWEPTNRVTLSWDRPRLAAIDHYNVYRVLAPQYHSISVQPRYEKVATVPAVTAQATLQAPPGYAGITDVRSFMVTAVDIQGRESAYADDRQLVRFAFPSAGARIERAGPGGRTARVTLGPQATIQLRESTLVEKDTLLQFRFRTRSRVPAGLRMSVAGLGDFQIALVGAAAKAVPMLAEIKGLNDGTWKQVRIKLRELLDSQAAAKRVTPADARTTWQHDWLITALRFGHLASSADGQAVSEVYEFEDMEITRVAS